MIIKPSNHFIDRNGFIPMRELEDSPHKPDGFELAPLLSQLKAEDLSVDDFYFNPNNAELPYCYYRAMVLLDFSSIDHKSVEMKALINRINKDINESVAKRDFDRFLSLVDSRLVPDLFIEVFNFIPDQEKYRLFERIWRFNPDSHAVFSEEFVRGAAKYKGVTSSQPVADEAGFVRIYMLADGQVLPPEQALSWTTDINIAILHALSFNPIPVIYQGRVHLDHIVSYDNARLKKEIKVVPHKVVKIEGMDLLNLLEFDKELKDSGIIDQYHVYSAQINNSWFHNPAGIHALSHTQRVLLLSLMIAYLENYNQADRKLLCMASIYHDIGRENDGYDPDHGNASYEKLCSEKLLALDKQDMEILRFLVQNHAIPDQSAYKKLNRYELADVDRTLRLYGAFKDADGLDRVRINDLNPEYLRTKSAHRLLLAAHQLFSQQIIY